MKSMPAFGRLKSFNLSYTYTPFTEDSSSILWQWRSDHHNQRILWVDSSQAIVQDQYTSEIRSVGEQSDISTIGAHCSGEGVGMVWKQEREHIYFLKHIGLGHFHDLISNMSAIWGSGRIAPRNSERSKNLILLRYDCPKRGESAKHNILQMTNKTLPSPNVYLFNVAVCNSTWFQFWAPIDRN